MTFKVKNYRVEGRARYTTMTLDTTEFIRRFLIHVLPKGFHRIRHYGLFAGGAKAAATGDGARAAHMHQRRTPPPTDATAADADTPTRHAPAAVPACASSRGSNAVRHPATGHRRGRIVIRIDTS